MPSMHEALYLSPVLKTNEHKTTKQSHRPMPTQKTCEHLTHFPHGCQEWVILAHESLLCTGMVD
jgi:hypothetical protein